MSPSVLAEQETRLPSGGTASGRSRGLRVRVPAGAIEIHADASPAAVRRVVDARLDRFPQPPEVDREEAVAALLRVRDDLREAGILTTGVVCGVNEDGQGVFWTYHVGLLELPPTGPFDAAGLLARVAAADMPTFGVEEWSAGGRPAVGLRGHKTHVFDPPSRVGGDVLVAVAASLVLPPGESSAIFISGTSLDASQLDPLSAMIALMAMSAHFQDEAADGGGPQ